MKTDAVLLLTVSESVFGKNGKSINGFTLIDAKDIEIYFMLWLCSQSHRVAFESDLLFPQIAASMHTNSNHRFDRPASPNARLCWKTPSFPCPRKRPPPSSTKRCSRPSSASANWSALRRRRVTSSCTRRKACLVRGRSARSRFVVFCNLLQLTLLHIFPSPRF